MAWVGRFGPLGGMCDISPSELHAYFVQPALARTRESELLPEDLAALKLYRKAVGSLPEPPPKPSYPTMAVADLDFSKLAAHARRP